MIWLYLILSYFVGCIMFGYIVIKIFHHKDIRLIGSGNVGARNAGRLHGRKEFVLIFLGDALKGVIVVVAASLFHFPDYILLLGLGMAIMGHIKPVTLNFKGGKGISTFIGGIIAFEPILVLILILGFIMLFPLTRSFTLSGLGSFLFIPFFLLYMEFDWPSCFIISIIIMIIYFAHLQNIKEGLRKFERKA